MAGQPRRVPVRYLLLLRDTLHASGVESSRLLELAGIDRALLENRDATLTSAQVDAFIAAATALSGRDDLGFELGRRIKMNSHALLGYGLLSCPTIDEFLRMASRHYHLIAETWHLRYSRRGRIGEALYTPMVALPPLNLRFYLETLAVAHQNHLRLFLGPDLPGYDIYLSMAPPPHAHRYLALLPARFHFEEGAVPGVRVRMPAELLDAPLALADLDVMREIDERCAAMGPGPPRGETGWGDYVMMVLREARGTLVSLDDIARRAGVSSKTIDRQLRKEGLRFRELSDRVRFERACELLCAPEASVGSVALQLGFSDTPNFSRSFRRVVGIAPSAYRRQCYFEAGATSTATSS